MNNKIIPHSIEAEKALLGILLTNNSVYEDIVEIVLPIYFSNKNYQKLFEAIAKQIESGKIADAITLEAFGKKHLSELGGEQFLRELVAATQGISSAIDYAYILKDLYMRRRLIDIGQELSVNAHNMMEDYQAQDCIEIAEKKIFELTEKQYGSVISMSVALERALQTAERAYKNKGNICGMPTGFIDIDRMIGGLNNSDLVIIAARPAMGKTAFATNIIMNLLLNNNKPANNNHSILMFSLEMSAEQIASRIFSQVCSVESDSVRKGTLNHAEFNKFVEITRSLGKLPLYIDDTPAITISQLRILARRAKKKQNISMVVVDYLQLLRPSTGYKAENRVQEVSEITRNLKAIAKELNIPVVALSQLSRAVEQRVDNRPQLSDLRDSGTIEQDADIVMFLYREAQSLITKQPAAGTPKHEQWQTQMATVQNRAEVIVSKNRHGPTGVIALFYDARYTRFSNLSFYGE